MAWVTPITNRTSDAQYTHADLNRVGNDVQYLADLLNSYGYSVSVSIKTDWTIGNLPSGMPPLAAQMTTYLDNIAALKAAFYGTTELPSSMSNLTAAQANNIEKLLVEIEKNINNMISSFWGCGEIGCGET